MKLQLPSQAAKFKRRCIRPSAPVLAALLLLTQVVAQNRNIPVSVNRADTDSLSQQNALVPDAPSPADSSASLAQDQASLVSSPAVPFFSLEAAQDHSRSSSQKAFTATPPTKATPPHHRLGVALAVVGTVALGAGIALYVGEQHTFCNSTSSGCSAAKDTGIALMPIGGAVAVTGFYLTFHR